MDLKKTTNLSLNVNENGKFAKLKIIFHEIRLKAPKSHVVPQGTELARQPNGMEIDNQ